MIIIGVSFKIFLVVHDFDREDRRKNVVNRSFISKKLCLMPIKLSFMEKKYMTQNLLQIVILQTIYDLF